ncbi:UNVERIFIED_CONTAM: hypothetical protein PYX00_008450 [Menopon gallinae]|uniref:Uncharacterized protein n=1 Tax=Menopon gallinae TaxID=328185 RepID=A0AAW2HN99_9NEOP
MDPHNCSPPQPNYKKLVDPFPYDRYDIFMGVARWEEDLLSTQKPRRCPQPPVQQPPPCPQKTEDTYNGPAVDIVVHIIPPRTTGDSDEDRIFE